VGLRTDTKTGGGLYRLRIYSISIKICIDSTMTMNVDANSLLESFSNLLNVQLDTCPHLLSLLIDLRQEITQSPHSIISNSLKDSFEKIGRLLVFNFQAPNYGSVPLKFNIPILSSIATRYPLKVNLYVFQNKLNILFAKR
jgi:hypothetical protein